MNDKPREILKMSPEEGRKIIYGDSADFEVISKDITGKSRWSINYYIVVKRLSDLKFFADNYSIGATESQEERPYEYSSPRFTEVFPVKRTITVYE